MVLLSVGVILPAVTLAQAPPYLLQWGSGGSGMGQFLDPVGVATDADGNVFVTDRDNHRVQKFTGEGSFLMQRGSPGSGDG